MGNCLSCCIAEELFLPIETVYRYDNNEPGLFYYNTFMPKWETKVSKIK